jgi:MoxR-like ATPase
MMPTPSASTAETSGHRANAAAALADVVSLRQRMAEALAPVIVGQRDVLEGVLVALVTGGHCLLEGVPGLAKTLLVKSVAQALALDFGRIQFTPDLMPADITGTEVLEEERPPASPTAGLPATRRLRFLPGQIFRHVLLADEINRAPPKTQSALLEAMQERHVTVGGSVHPLPDPFIVLATRNPIEQEGTYPLPEGQLDRFMFLLHVDYPDSADELEIVRRTTGPGQPRIAPVVDREMLAAAARTVRALPVSDHVMRRAVELARATRPTAKESPAWLRSLVRFGAGPRASQFMVLAAKALAAFDGRPCAEVRDVNQAAAAVLRHRIITTFEAESEGIRPDAIIARLLGVDAAPSAIGTTAREA